MLQQPLLEVGRAELMDFSMPGLIDDRPRRLVGSNDEAG
jgi:hypothetical protein